MTDKKEALLFDMALETAMRLGEIFTLKTEDVDLSRRTIFIHRSKPGHRKQVPISSVLLEKLQRADLTQEYAFPDWWQGEKKNWWATESPTHAPPLSQGRCPASPAVVGKPESGAAWLHRWVRRGSLADEQVTFFIDLEDQHTHDLGRVTTLFAD